MMGIPHTEVREQPVLYVQHQTSLCAARAARCHGTAVPPPSPSTAAGPGALRAAPMLGWGV